MSRDRNTVYIGRKPVMNYVLAVITNFNSADTNHVTLKARGRAITTAVDVAEIVKHRFMSDLNASEITLGTDEVQQQEGGTRNVSTMEIKLTRASPVKQEAHVRSDEPEAATPAHSTELTSIKGLGATRTEKLQSHGVHSIQDLAKSDAKTLAANLQMSEKRVTKWIDEAKKTLKQ